MSRSLKLIAVLAIATLGVTACGKRGVLEPPNGSATSSPDVTGKKIKRGKTDPKAEHRENPLDGLLR